MTIGTSLFHGQTLRTLSRAGDEIASLQARISSGENDPRASADPVRALRLSAAEDQMRALDRFSVNLERAGARLDQADTVLKEGADILRRVSDLAVWAASDTVTRDERVSIASEVAELRDSLMGIANTRDDTGRALFGGHAALGDAFTREAGAITYRGDGGQSRLRVSESMTLPTGLSGQDVFGAEPGVPNGGVFGAIDGFLGSLARTGPEPVDGVTSERVMTLRPALTRAPAEWSMTLAGPAGEATVSFAMADGALPSAVSAINAASARTGITATLDADGGALILSGAGSIGVSQVSAKPAPEGSLIGVRDAAGAEHAIVAADRTRGGAIEALRAATDQLIDARTRIGAMSASAERQEGVIDSRKVMMDKAVSGLKDVDLADALTRLKQALTERDASQQAYVKITQRNLFDYLR